VESPFPRRLPKQGNNEVSRGGHGGIMRSVAMSDRASNVEH
jgi:hypothetical protein